MSTRKEQKEAMRRERMERERAKAEAARRRRLVGYGAAALLAIAAIAAVVVVVLGGDDGGGGGPGGGGSDEVSYPDDPPAIPSPREFNLRRAAEAAGCELVDPEHEGSDHVSTSVAYRANPPTSGNHHPLAAEDDDYEASPGTENLVHALEHGRIIYQFRPDAPQQVIDRLFALFEEDTYHTIITPNATRMKPLVAATAWDHAIHCNELNDRTFDALRAFKDRYRDKGPEFVP